MSYNEDEVQELFEVVFKLSAKDIKDKLDKVQNRVDIARRRWFWELLQNAKDAVKRDELVSVKLVVDIADEKPYVVFFHNGNPFRYQDAKNLIFPYSDKADEDDTDKSGRFGTGFLATHILSREINVNGVYQKADQAYRFQFTLDRSGNNKPEIAESINKTWQQFRINRTLLENYQYNKSGFETSFQYNLDPVQGVQLVLDSITDFEQSIPYVLAFIGKIHEIEIIDNIQNRKILFSRAGNSRAILAEHIEKVLITRSCDCEGNVVVQQTELVICSGSQVSIAMETITDQGTTTIKEFSLHQPLLFSPFPLIGANDFKFPVVVNSSSFIPKEERDGIWLNSEGFGLVNQKIFEQVPSLYSLLVNFAASNNWNNRYLLLKGLKETLTLADFNSTWYKEKILAPIKSFLADVPLVENALKKISIENTYFPADTKKENRLKLWDFLNPFFPDKLPMRPVVNLWDAVIWEECPKVTIASFTRYIAGFKTVAAIEKHLGWSKEQVLSWLNDYVGFITSEDPALLNKTETQILPNQHGNFKRKDELYLDDESIDEDLKLILAGITKFTSKVYDWRDDMLEKEIYLELPPSRTRTIAMIGTTISDTVKDLLRDDNPSNELRDLFSLTLNWLNDHPQKAKDFFKGLKTETLLYKTANDRKIKHITDLLQKDRDGELSVEQLSALDSKKIAILNDPNLELKVSLGEQVLQDMAQQQEEFTFKKKTGDLFEKMFHQIINADGRFGIAKVEGEEDFIITNKTSGQEYYVELKSVSVEENKVEMTHRQAKKAFTHPENYFLCIIPNSGEDIDEIYFRENAVFDSAIGVKLSHKVGEALAFEAPLPGLSVHFEDTLLSSFHKYRYKFAIDHSLWGSDKIETFTTRIS